MHFTAILHPDNEELNGFGASVHEVGDVGNLDQAQFEEIRMQLYDHQFLVIPNQKHVHPDQFAKFIRQFDPSPAILKGDDKRADATVWRDLNNNPWEIEKCKAGIRDVHLAECTDLLAIGQGVFDNGNGSTISLGGVHENYGGTVSNSQVVSGSMLQWHIDGAFYQTLPPVVTSLLCQVTPVSRDVTTSYQGSSLKFKAGATAFASGRLAYEMLSDKERQLADSAIVHYGQNPFKRALGLTTADNGVFVNDDGRDYSEAFDQMNEDPGSMSHPLVWKNPATGKKALQAHPRCMLFIEFPHDALSVRDSQSYLNSLMSPAVNPDYVYCHNYSPGDMVIWDNFSVWHSATGGLKQSDQRMMYLCSYNGSIVPS